MKKRKVLIGLSLIGLLINFLEALNYNIKWGIGLRNFDLDTLFGIGIISVVALVITTLAKIEKRFFTSILIGCLYGFYKAINLYSLSGGAFGLVSLFTANHTITITLVIILIISIVSLKKEGDNSNQVSKEVKEVKEIVVNKTKYILLAFFLGSFGLHKFYEKKNGLGIFYLIICFTGISCLLGVAEAIIMAFNKKDDFGNVVIK